VVADPDHGRVRLRRAAVLSGDGMLSEPAGRFYGHRRGERGEPPADRADGEAHRRPVADERRRHAAVGAAPGSRGTGDATSALAFDQVRCADPAGPLVAGRYTDTESALTLVPPTSTT